MVNACMRMRSAAALGPTGTTSAALRACEPASLLWLAVRCIEGDMVSLLGAA